MKAVAAAASAALLVSVVAACGKREGGPCKGLESTCADKKNTLACHDGKLVKVPCDGALGCNNFQDHANCDDSIATEGAACMSGPDDEYACTPDKTRALLCGKSKRFERYLECRGPNRCAGLGQQVSCDTSVAVKGDPCKAEVAAACAVDGKEMLVCHLGAFGTYRYCRGHFGCRQNGDTPQCDESLSLEDDPCGIPGRVVCSVDGKAELVCQGSRYTLSRHCRKTGCTVTNRPSRPTDCD